MGRAVQWSSGQPWTPAPCRRERPLLLAHQLAGAGSWQGASLASSDGGGKAQSRGGGGVQVFEQTGRRPWVGVEGGDLGK